MGDKYLLGRAEVRGHTDHGLWVWVDSLGEEVFVPYRHIHTDSEVYEEYSDPGELVVSRWLARKRGWSED